MPSERHGLIDYPLPVPAEVAKKLLSDGNPLACVAELSEAECREFLGHLWAAIEHPINRAVAKHLLSAPKLCISGNQQGRHFLSFLSGDVGICLSRIRPGTTGIPADFASAAIPGLLEFLTWFGGMEESFYADGLRGFGNQTGLRVMWHADKDSAWGYVAPWDGSLVLYENGGGDVVVLRPDGAVGRWVHEFADPVSTAEEYREVYEDFLGMVGAFDSKLHENAAIVGHAEGATRNLHLSFSELVENYVDYCGLPPDSEQKAKSPFF